MIDHSAIAELAADEAEQIDFASGLEARQTSPWEIDGRPIRLLEMEALRTLRRARRKEQFREHGYCCESGPLSAIGCKHGGPCPLLQAADQILKEHHQ